MTGSRARARDVVDQAAKSVVRRPGRSLLTALGTVVGVAGVVATLGLSASASHQVSGAFDAVRATEVTLRDGRPGDAAPAFLPASERRLRRLNGVEAAGRTWRLPGRRISSGIGASDDFRRTDVLAASPGAVAAMRITLRVGRAYDELAEVREEPVVVLGGALADQLGLGELALGSTVLIDDLPFTVVGIIEDVLRRPEVLTGALVPMSVLDRLGTSGTEEGPEVLIETAPGAALTIAGQAPYAVRPEDPDRIRALAPPDPRRLRQRVEADLRTLALVLAALMLASGALSIGVTSFAAVLERVPEIGLRRAVGARPVHIAAQVLAESAITGSAGGIVGVSAGVIALVGLTAARGWQPVLPPLAVLGAPLLGTVTGLVAGLLPAVRAARIQPVDALRR